MDIEPKTQDGIRRHSGSERYASFLTSSAALGCVYRFNICNVLCALIDATSLSDSMTRAQWFVTVFVVNVQIAGLLPRRRTIVYQPPLFNSRMGIVSRLHL